MLLMKEYQIQKTSTTCVCGSRANLQSGTRSFTIGGKSIVVYNVPHYYCSRCDIASYDSTVNIDELLIYAYKNDLHKLDWNNKPDGF